MWISAKISNYREIIAFARCLHKLKINWTKEKRDGRRRGRGHSRFEAKCRGFGNDYSNEEIRLIISDIFTS